MGIEFQILGPLEVRVDGIAVAIGGPRQRALLAVLLLSANRVVSRDRLIDELLDDAPEGKAERMLRVQVSRLRGVLNGVEGDPPRLVACAPGYVLRVEPGELDLQVFEELLAEGHHAFEAQDFAQASRALCEAEALWRGRPLADLEFERFARNEIERLEELRVTAIESRIEADLALGRHAMLVGELEAIVAEHPLRERARGQLMLALYRSGRQAEALATYRIGRSLLVEELAIEPGPQLKQLETAILAQDATLDAPRRDAQAGGALAVAVDIAEAASDRTAVKLIPHRARWWRDRVAALAFGVAVVLAGIGFVLGTAGTATSRGQLRGNVLALVAPGSGAIVATIRLAAPPAGIAAGFGSLWATEPAAGALVRIDASRGAVLATIPVGTRPTRVIAAGGRIWVLDPADHTLSSIDPDTHTVAQTIAVGSEPSDVVLSGGSLWVSNERDGTVIRIDPNSGRIEGVVRTGGDPSGLAASPNAVWVATDRAGTVVRIQARTGKITNTLRVGDGPAEIVATPAAVWVLDPLDATVSRVDPRRVAVVASVALGGAPAGLALAGGSVWVGDRRGGSLFRVDPRHNWASSTQFGGRVSSLVAARGLWVAVDAAGPSRRGGTLTAATSYQVIDAVDPAAASSTNVSPPQFLGMTNDGLVTLDHVTGPNGTRLVPDLAMSLPLPTDGGRTYTFRLRPSLQYSTGATLKASDVTHSFERLFAIASSGTAWYGSIAGAATCRRRPARCDLSRGIVADDKARTVIFHLIRPDPDFLYKLTLTYADVLPTSIPDRQARSPLPATGPYRVSRYLPGHEVLLIRNPRFHEWSAAAQPDGYPDGIRLRLDRNGPQGAASVAEGTADFMANLGKIPNAYAAYFLQHHRNQVRVNPLTGTSFMFLNVRVPPFNDIRVRRALNLALDRARIVDAYGGPTAAQPTCQLLPPGIPGYSRYCPYTRDPARAGRWSAPDLSAAKRLVTASGTAGMKVTVWNTPAPQVAVDETNDAVAALRQLGYRAALRVLPDSTYFAYTGDSRNQAQVIDGGWGADYASANDFIGKLTCNYFVPANGVATTDASEFCDPAIDRQISHADSLQTANPPAAPASWARIDHALTDLAIWLPTVTLNEADLISRRTGNYQYNPVWGALLDQLTLR